MTTIFDSSTPVKTVSFGRGIAPPRTTHFEPTDEDRAWAAELFDGLEQERHQAENRRLEELALEAAWNDQFNDTMPITGHCLNCGVPSNDLTPEGLCDRCDTLAAEDSIASVNQLFGLGRRVF